MHDIALIGAGRIGKIHAANLAANPRLRLARVIDPFPEAAASVAAQYGAEVSTIEAALADPAIAGVVVASSTDTHLPYSLAAAEAGKAIFCEKPLDQDLTAARLSAARFAALNARLFLAFNRRFDPNFAALQARLAGGAVGALETLHIISHDPAPPPVKLMLNPSPGPAARTSRRAASPRNCGGAKGMTLTRGVKWNRGPAGMPQSRAISSIR